MQKRNTEGFIIVNLEICVKVVTSRRTVNKLILAFQQVMCVLPGNTATGL